MNVEIGESDRQLILLALALISLERPGWHYITGEIAQKFQGRQMFEDLRTILRKKVKGD